MPYTPPIIENDGGTSYTSPPPSQPITPISSAKPISSGVGSSYYDLLRQISEQNNAFNLAQVDMVNSFNAHEAAKNREWQERMSRNAHRYEVEDLLAAGLNPVLSAGGQGAYVGSGAVASGQKAVADNIYGNGVVQLMSSAMAASSAQRVAEIYAAASMYGHDVTKYGYDINQKTQYRYQDILRQNTLDQINNSADNNTRSGIFGMLEAGIGLLGTMLYANGMKKRKAPNYVTNNYVR